MSGCRTFASSFRLLLFSATFLLVCHTQLWGGGLSWGPVVVDPPVASCLADVEPALVSGPLRSPFRLVDYGPDSFLLTDRGGAVYQLLKADPDHPLLLLRTEGQPLGLAIDDEKLLVGNESSGKIDLYKFRHKGLVGAGSLPRSGRIQALDLAIDSLQGRIFVVDGLDRNVKVYDRRGKLTLTMGAFGELNQPQALALDEAAQEVIVSDYGDPRIGISPSVQIFDYSGRHLKTINGTFSRPQGVWSTGASIYLVDAMLGQILELARDTGELLSSNGCLGTSAGHLMMPMDLLYDSSRKEFFVADNRNGRVTVLPASVP